MPTNYSLPTGAALLRTVFAVALTALAALALAVPAADAAKKKTTVVVIKGGSAAVTVNPVVVQGLTASGITVSASAGASASSSTISMPIKKGTATADLKKGTIGNIAKKSYVKMTGGLTLGGIPEAIFPIPNITVSNFSLVCKRGLLDDGLRMDALQVINTPQAGTLDTNCDAAKFTAKKITGIKLVLGTTLGGVMNALTKGAIGKGGVFATATLNIKS